MSLLFVGHGAIHGPINTRDWVRYQRAVEGDSFANQGESVPVSCHEYVPRDEGESDTGIDGSDASVFQLVIEADGSCIPKLLCVGTEVGLGRSGTSSPSDRPSQPTQRGT